MPSTQLNDDTPDEQLLNRIADGDQHAFVVLFRRRRADVYRFALHMTASAATADDVTQEVFMTVMREAARYQQDRATVMAWLAGIARNLVRRRLDRDRMLQPLEETEARQAWASAADDPLADLARAQRIATLRRAILSLPLRYREVVVLCDLQELSYADAAAALGCAIGTVRSRLHRARGLLGAKLRDGQYEDSAVKLRDRRCFV